MESRRELIPLVTSWWSQRNAGGWLFLKITLYNNYIYQPGSCIPPSRSQNSNQLHGCGTWNSIYASKKLPWFRYSWIPLRRDEFCDNSLNHTRAIKDLQTHTCKKITIFSSANMNHLTKYTEVRDSFPIPFSLAPVTHCFSETRCKKRTTWLHTSVECLPMRMRISRISRTTKGTGFMTSRMYLRRWRILVFRSPLETRENNWIFLLLLDVSAAARTLV